jgi:hypothetical protein
MRNAVILALALPLCACANHNWAAGPNVNPHMTFEQQKAQCSMMARHGGTMVAAAGDTASAAAAVPSRGLITGAVNRANDFDDCMQAAGYVKAGQ